MCRQRVPKQPKIVSVVIFGDRDETAVLALAASLGRTIDEVLSAAIFETALEDIIGLNVDHVQLITDRGVAGSVDGHIVALGDSSFLSDLGLSIGSFEKWAERMAPQGENVMFVSVDGEPAGFIRYQ